MEALRILGISDQTVEKTIPLLQDALGSVLEASTSIALVSMADRKSTRLNSSH